MWVLGGRQPRALLRACKGVAAPRSEGSQALRRLASSKHPQHGRGGLVGPVVALQREQQEAASSALSGYLQNGARSRGRRVLGPHCELQLRSTCPDERGAAMEVRATIPEEHGEPARVRVAALRARVAARAARTRGEAAGVAEAAAPAGVSEVAAEATAPLSEAVGVAEVAGPAAGCAAEAEAAGVLQLPVV